ncbi:MAG: Adenylate kinase [Candidatus Methanofastidiosum methylothiophilum]|jgi:adenylate kinase|uniref:Adenylate kinase n=1 Tax=Candidatus Methanofastidiosum methylothiophilum TaxID=1705564 RepID=A0A150JHE1_9EURY|nr:MAG: Adenylate kinase [Candidatus Methanofastidiosum methylthiophilus]MBP6932940.1 adenylate kinase [Methanofastidiosum sp.]OQC51332.1 MAG: Adenylate kinase [Euryarchaeota archaeon ADurb.Bin023]KYC56615.1 MAG: Adenylate kinase [Candidatus Methanofastidiosum methylthiophilus]KYC58340.1 MAG: Adenylate kinase [Candidatus Methanofastidiosum methylthiophilus]
MRIILLGPPGCGKGTQAEIICKTFDIPHISTGDILRNNVKRNTEIGLSAKKYMDIGSLVPDKIIIQMIKDRFLEDDCKKGFLLDGFPRTIAQAEALDDLLGQMSISLDHIINIDVPDEDIINRISKRLSCANCGEVYNLLYKKPKKEMTCDSCGFKLHQREDDKEEVIRNRLEVYRKQTAPLIKYYKQKIKNVNGNKNITEVTNDILNILKY